jgi:hypothetical protein
VLSCVWASPFLRLYPGLPMSHTCCCRMAHWFSSVIPSWLHQLAWCYITQIAKNRSDSNQEIVAFEHQCRPQRTCFSDSPSEPGGGLSDGSPTQRLKIVTKERDYPDHDKSSQGILQNIQENPRVSIRICWDLFCKLAKLSCNLPDLFCILFVSFEGFNKTKRSAD